MMGQRENGQVHTTYVCRGDHDLQKTGIRGTKSWVLFTIIFLMIMMAVANLTLSVAILYILRFDFEGMQGIEMVPPSVVTRFMQDTEMESLAPFSGKLDSLPDTDLELTGHEAGVKLEVQETCTHIPPSVTGKDKISVSVQPDGIQMVADEGFHVIGRDGRPVFTTDDQELDMPWIQNVSQIILNELVTSKISSSKGSSLQLESEGEATIQGMLGLEISGNQVVIVGRKDVHFKSRGTGLKLSAPQGIYFEKIRNFRLSRGKKHRARSSAVAGNSLCVCGNNGRVFIVPDKGRGLSCANANEHINPCI